MQSWETQTTMVKMSDLFFTVHQHGGDDVTWKPPIENFHSRYCNKRKRLHKKSVQQLCKFLETKETFYMRNEFTTDNTFSVHQHGRRFIVLFCWPIGKKSVTSVTMIAKFLDHKNMEIKQQRRQRERQKSNRLILAKQQLCTCITLFCTCLSRRCTTATWNFLISRVRVME